MTATAELVVPRSIPMTEPLTFSLESSAYLRTKDEVSGDLKAAVGARKLEAARGRKVRDNLEGNIIAVVWGECKCKREELRWRRWFYGRGKEKAKMLELGPGGGEKFRESGGSSGSAASTASRPLKLLHAPAASTLTILEEHADLI